MNFCPHCHSGHDPVLSQLIWSCGNTMNDPQWRTKECYKRNLELANERIKRLDEDYHDLIMQVERKFDGETRHETAKRYIRNAEAIQLDKHEAKEAKP